MNKSKIRELPLSVQEKIAAGEVIERPASVIRELIDNSIDSGADSIDIFINNSGSKEITVKDNGTGMSCEDLRICWMKHTTSKICQMDDISNITTMGFRGEALSSISFVSSFEIESRHKDEENGWIINIEDQKIISEKPIARTIGTTVRAKNIFYNLPARKAFMKSSQSEMRAIKEVILQKALAFPDIAISLTSETKKIIQLGKRSSVDERIQDIFGYQVSSEFFPISGSIAINSNDISVNGLVGKPFLFKSSRKVLHLFVNGRWIINNTFLHAIYSAYEPVIPKGTYVPAFIYLTIPPSFLDVNIHPAKKEVKILYEKEIHRLIRTEITKAFEKNTGLVSTSSSDISGIQKSSFRNTSYGSNDAAASPDTNKYPGHYPDSQNRIDYPDKSQAYTTRPESEWTNEAERSASKGHEFKVSGIIFNTFIVLEYEDFVLFVDQHAAHERINFEEIMQKRTKGPVPTQKLLYPFTVEVNPDEVEYLQSRLDTLSEFGLELQHFGDTSFAVQSVPYFFPQNNPKQAVEELVVNIIEDKAITREALLKEMVSVEACRKSIFAGDYQSLHEARSLIERLLRYPNPFTCPHGRPISKRFSKDEFYKLFNR